MFNLKKFPGENDYMNLSAIDDRHLKATLFVNDKLVKSKTIKGSMNNKLFRVPHKSFLFKIRCYLIWKTNKPNFAFERRRFILRYK